MKSGKKFIINRLQTFRTERYVSDRTNMTPKQNS
jgi:hypothetical protein